MTTPEFIKDLRRHIGHAPLWLIGATVLVLRDGVTGPEVLLLRRSDNGDWAGIAGIVEPGEHPVATVVREALEEGSIEIEVERMLWLLVMEEITYVNGDRCRFLDHGFRARLVGGQPGPGDGEACDWGWFPVDELPEPRQERLEALVRICLADPSEPVTDLEGW